MKGVDILKSKIAMIIRVATVPPIMIALLLVALFFQQPNIFHNNTDYAVSLITLGICPILVYPVWAAVPKLKATGRDGQRKLAFVGTLIGYAAAFLYGEISGVTPELKLLFRTYFIAVVVLTFFNKALKIKASGHACSVVSPALMMIYFQNWLLVSVWVLIIAISFWGSLISEHHKPKELAWGSIICILAFVASCLITI